MTKNQKLESLLVKHLSTPKLHQQILSNFNGIYTLGIGKNLQTGEPNIVLVVPNGVNHNFIDSIILEGIEFNILIEYNLKTISPY